MASQQQKTTETLRQTLLEAIDGVLNGKLEPQSAVAIAKLSEQVIKTAHLEIQYTGHLEKLDKSAAGIAAGPMLLAGSSGRPE